jgi:hypothetical protein
MAKYSTHIFRHKSLFGGDMANLALEPVGRSGRSEADDYDLTARLTT